MAVDRERAGKPSPRRSRCWGRGGVGARCERWEWRWAWAGVCEALAKQRSQASLLFLACVAFCWACVRVK
jgi:hypothetical protein